MLKRSLCLFIFLTQLTYANGFISNYCDQYYLNYSDARNTQPILNVDKVFKEINDWVSKKFKNELSVTKIGESEGEDILRLDLPSRNPLAKRILITAGLHGNEPFGVTALMEFIEKTIYDNSLRNEYEFVFLPMMNPKALKNSTRLTSDKIDLNRTFSIAKQTPQSRSIMNALQNEHFEMAIDLHGSIVREGFFIIRSGESDVALAQSALKNVPEEFIFQSQKEQYPEIIPSVKNPSIPAYQLSHPGIATSFN